MEIKDYLLIPWRRKWVILITLLVTEAVVAFFTLKTTPIYVASTTMRIATATTGSVNYSDYMYADRLMNTYVRLATTKPVLDELKQRLGLTYLPGIGVEIVSKTELMQIRVTHSDPILAAEIANTLADILVSKSMELYTGGGQSSLDILNGQLKEMESELEQARKEYTDLAAKTPGDTIAIQNAKDTLDSKQNIYNTILKQYEQARLDAAIREKSISVVDPAIPPSSPSKPNKMMNLALGGFVSLLGGVGLALLLDGFDTTLYSVEQIEKLTKQPLLGTIPTTDARELLSSMNGSTPYNDAFRRLRSSLLLLLQDLPYHTLLVTSAEPGEGKSTIVTNLAYVLAQAGRNVVVIDCDLRRPTLHKNFDLPNEQGISNVLSQRNDFEGVLQDDKLPGLKIVTSGPLPSNPADLLCSEEMISLKYRLRQKYDLVLIDSPAMLSVSDAILLAPAVDGVVLVVSRSYTRKEDVLNACKQLADIHVPILGVVINRAEQHHGYYYPKTRRPWEKIQNFARRRSRV